MDISTEDMARLTEQYPVFKTDLYFPEYPKEVNGEWEIKKVGLCLDHGYHTGLWMVKELPVLLKRGKDGSQRPETWMSPSPHEIESQEASCRNAFGNTVVMGLGLGWVAINMALNPDVDKVTILEIDPQVIDLVESLGVLDKLPGNIGEKIHIVKADAMEWTPEQPVDFLYADIWKHLAEVGTLDQVRQMQKNIQAKQVYFWGQEIIIYNEARKQWPDMQVLDNDILTRCIDQVICLPLLIPENEDYATLIERVIQNRHSRGLPLERQTDA